MGETRIEWIDIAKGIGIILVIAGHTFYLGYSYPLYAFHMPLFFFLSGLLFVNKKNGFFDFLKSKTKSILRPWLIMLIISFLVCIVIPEWRSQITLKSVTADLYTANTNVFQNSSLWYLVCFYFVLLLAFFVNKIKFSRLTKLLFLLLFIALLWSKELLELTILPFHRFPFKIDSALVALFFFLVAYWYKDVIFKLCTAKINTIIVALVFAISGVLCVFNGWSNINSLDFGRIRLLYYPIALSGIGSVCLITQFLGGAFLVKIKRMLVFYGKNSLIIFGFQSLFIRLYLLLFNKIQGLEMELYANNPIYHQIGSFVVVSFIVSPLIVILFNQLRNKGIRIL